MRKKILFGFYLFIILLFSSFVHAISFPNLTGQIVDAAGILTPQTQEKIRTVLALSDQTVVVTIPSLEGLSIESYGYQLGRYWGIGNKNKDDGVLLLVAPNERSVRIEVGYGLEEILTDSISSTLSSTSAMSSALLDSSASLTPNDSTGCGNIMFKLTPMSPPIPLVAKFLLSGELS